MRSRMEARRAQTIFDAGASLISLRLEDPFDSMDGQTATRNGRRTEIEERRRTQKEGGRRREERDEERREESHSLFDRSDGLLLFGRSQVVL